MDYSTFLPRRLSQGGCVVVGTKIGATHGKFKADKIKLLPKSEASVQKVLEKTNALELLSSTEATMTEIDRGTDRCIAGYHDQLDAIQRCFDHASILPLSDGHAARLADATLVRGALLPNGTGFLKLTYSQQWVRMSAMIQALDQKDVTTAIKRLGLGAETERLRAWVDLYGAKLGVTDSKDTDPAAVAVQAWHEAYGELMVHLHSEYDAGDSAELKIRDALVSPYEVQADEERRADQKARAKRKPVEGPGNSAG